MWTQLATLVVEVYIQLRTIPTSVLTAHQAMSVSVELALQHHDLSQLMEATSAPLVTIVLEVLMKNNLAQLESMANTLDLSLRMTASSAR